MYITFIFKLFFEKSIKYSSNENHHFVLLSIPHVTSQSVSILFDYFESLIINRQKLSPSTCFQIIILMDYLDMKKNVSEFIEPLTKLCLEVINLGNNDDQFFLMLNEFEISELIFFEKFIPKKLFDKFDEEIKVYKSVSMNPLLIQLSSRVTSIESSIELRFTSIESHIESRMTTIECTLTEILLILKK